MKLFESCIHYSSDQEIAEKEQAFISEFRALVVAHKISQNQLQSAYILLKNLLESEPIRLPE